MVYGWETLAQDLGAIVFGFKNTKIRVPKNIQEKYIAALKLKLFNLFVICWAFEPKEDELTKPEKVDYYLFGSPSSDLSEDIFLIDQWQG